MQRHCSYCKRLSVDFEDTSCEGCGAPLEQDETLAQLNGWRCTVTVGYTTSSVVVYSAPMHYMGNIYGRW